MTMPITVPVFRAFTAAGAPLANGKVFFYQAGTTNPVLTYSDPSYTAFNGSPFLNPHPVILDANGEAPIYVGSIPYHIVLQDSAGNVQWDKDNVWLGQLPYGLMNHNLIINGGMELWQTGTSFPATVSGAQFFTADGFQAMAVTGGTIGDFVFSRVAAGRNGSAFAHRIQRAPGSVSTGQVYLAQNAENTDTQPFFGGGVGQPTPSTILLSLWIRFGANYAGGNLFVSVNASDPTGAADVSLLPTGFYPPGGNSRQTIITSFPTDWTQYILPVTNPTSLLTSVVPGGPFSGGQLGLLITNLNYSGTAGANDWFDVDDVQIEVASAAPYPTPTMFERETFQRTLERAQRRYFKTFPQSVVPAQNAGVAGAYTMPQVVAATVAMTTWSLPQPAHMRNGFGVDTGYNPSVANAQLRNTTIGADVSATTVLATIGEIHATFNAAAASAVGNVNRFHYTIDKRF